MREIKFRGRKICKNEWVYGYYIEDGLNNHYIVEIKDNKDKDYYYGKTYRYVEVIPETIEQFTGLYDKNNIPIYEGDIITFESGFGGRETCLIYYDEQLLSLNMKWYQKGYVYDGLSYLRRKEKIEVIGNIFDNKENNNARQ